MVESVEKQATNVATPERRTECLDVLMRRFGIDAALVGVPKLARALGMGASTIYAYMRAGTFFMTYRMVNGTPMVKVDDLIDWYLSAEADVRPFARAAIAESQTSAASLLIANQTESLDTITPVRRGRKRGADARRMEFRPIDVASKEDADEAVDGLVASVMARIDRHLRHSPPAQS